MTIVLFFPNLLPTFLLSNLNLTNSGQAERNSVMTGKSGHSMKSQNLAVTGINHCGHSG